MAIKQATQDLKQQPRANVNSITTFLLNVNKKQINQVFIFRDHHLILELSNQRENQKELAFLLF